MSDARTGHLRKLLVGWFGATIIATALALGAVAWVLSPEPSRWRHTVEDLQAFVGNEFALVWDDAAQRTALAQRTANGLDVEIVLRDASGAEIERHGAACDGHGITARVDTRGSVEACWRHEGRGGWGLLFGLVAAAGVLWAAAGLLARRLTQPFDRLTEFANRLAEGDLDARVDLGDRPRGEPAIVAAALNEMAGRVQEQIAEGRALLAAVSHEIRTPLGHLRVLVELLRERGADEAALVDIEREVGDLDALVSKLLADARLQFSALTRTRLAANAVAARALAQAGLAADLLAPALDDDTFDADPTLVARALGNLLENAASHGGGARVLRVELDADEVTFAVDDDGEGFDDEEIERAFDPFVRGAGSGAGSTLGLGLSLVQRIALAHGGTAWIRNRDGGGATVAFTVRRA